MTVEDYMEEYTNFGGETVSVFKYERSVFVTGSSKYTTAIFRGISDEDVNDFVGEKISELKDANLAPGNIFYSLKLKKAMKQSS